MGSTIEDVTGINLSNDSRADQARRGQSEAAGASNAAQLQMYNQTRDDLSGYRDAGAGALSSMAGGHFMDGWKQDPGYQFRMQEGMKALQGSAAAKGSLNSGATLKALTRFGQDNASQEYGNVYNREFGRLSQLANLGQNSAAQTGAAGQNYANAYGQNVTGAANANAAAMMGQNGQTSGLIQGGITAAAMMGGGGPKPTYCDSRLKQNIQPVSREDLEELRAAIKPYHFEYIAKEFGEGEWVGIMAQDIEKTKLGRTVVVEDHAGHKKVHLNKLLSLLVASFAEGAA